MIPPWCRKPTMSFTEGKTGAKGLFSYFATDAASCSALFASCTKTKGTSSEPWWHGLWLTLWQGLCGGHIFYSQLYWRFAGLTCWSLSLLPLSAPQAKWPPPLNFFFSSQAWTRKPYCFWEYSQILSQFHLLAYFYKSIIKWLQFYWSDCPTNKPCDIIIYAAAIWQQSREKIDFITLNLIWNYYVLNYTQTSITLHCNTPSTIESHQNWTVSFVF